MAYVYWIRLPQHTDILTEGYVGFTSKSIEERFKKHIADALGKAHRNYPIQNAIRKYGHEALIASVVLEGSDEYCLFIEAKLRNKPAVGWNLVVGGSKPPSAIGRKVTDVNKAIISASQKGRIRTKETLLKMSKNRLGKKASEETKRLLSAMRSGKRPWEHTQAIKPVWLAARTIYDIFVKNPTISRRLLYLAVGLGSISRIQDNLKAGWNPNEDADWLRWYENNKG